ncbi:MAG: glycerophosphodiester phosphodiesterase [Chloroflexota bacterium]
MKGKIALGLIGLLLFIYLILAWRVEPVPPHPYFDGLNKPTVLAHQGGEWLFPSNTLLAMEGARALGVDVLEMDIHATSDGVLILMHDDTVDRTTDGTGAIKEMTFAQLRQLDAGYYWTDDDGATYPYRGQGILVPSFEEILTTFPDMRLNVEIKQQEPSIVVSTCQLIRQHGMAEKVLLASFHQVVMEEFRAACPEVATSMVAAEIRPFWILNTLFLGRLYQAPANAHAFQVPERSTLPVLGEVQVITPRFVRNAQRHNIEVHVWTINETAAMERLLATGVDGLITDRPDLMLALLDR